MNDREAGGSLLIFFEDDNTSVGWGGVGCELGDFADGEFVAVAVGGARDVVGVGEQGGEGAGVGMEGGVEGGGY